MEVFCLICVQNKDYSISLRSGQGYEEHNQNVFNEFFRQIDQLENFAFLSVHVGKISFILCRVTVGGILNSKRTRNCCTILQI